MAKKIFRLHSDGATQETGWFNSKAIDKNSLSTIKTKGKDVATSIPTPFATIDLVKSAFRWVADNGITGKTAHHKLVSDALDVAQLFYNSQKFKSKIHIVSWEPKERFKDIEERGKTSHKKYTKTLNLFWNEDCLDSSDDVLYNFEKVNRLYFILSNETKEIIGATSPATLFIAAPDVRRVTKGLDIKIASDELFDNDLAALHQRETSFIVYMFTLAKQPNFAHYFPEVSDYLNKVKEELRRETKSIINDLEADALSKYEPCAVLGNINDTCEVLGISLGVQKVDLENIASESDFVIKGDYTPQGTQPLVLPQNPFSSKLTYTTKGVVWDEKMDIPYKNTSSESSSKLPVQNDPYYWLSIGNFLEDNIIKLPYPIDNSKFKTCGASQFLLPLTETFFKYFDAEKVSEYLSIKERSGGTVEAELRLPIRGGQIVFSKHYSKADRNIQELDFHLAIFPFIKSNNPIKYNIGVRDNRRGNINQDIEVLLSNKGNVGVLTDARHRSEGIGMFKSTYRSIEKSFDLIKVSDGLSKAAIVPQMPVSNGLETTEFAIDFGTTNTHIEYRYASNAPKSFDVDGKTPLWQSLLNRNIDEFKGRRIYLNNEEAFSQEIMPYEIGKDISFPLRTALVTNKDTDFNKPKIELVKDVNNYLLLENKKTPVYLNLDTQIKWIDTTQNSKKKKVESYIEYLLTLVYYKTLMLGGNPKETKITWFYPVSMDKGEKALFEESWDELYKKVFSQTNADNIISIPESIAPYLSKMSDMTGLSLTIDIGGGSSDIAVFNNGKTAELISSFKFAGNAIFGDGYPNEYASDSDSNGFVKMFRNDFIKDKNDSAKIDLDSEKYKILEDILFNRKSSADFSSFLFALGKDENVNFDYAKQLKADSKMKLPIFIFYSAIAYYSAQLLKRSGIEVPNGIMFSGTASKSSEIINLNDRTDNLSPLFTFIFEKVYEKDLAKKIKIEKVDNPKELTCKGALNAGFKNTVDSSTKFWIGHIEDELWGKSYDKEEDYGSIPKYGEINSKISNGIESSIMDFYSILDEYVGKINLQGDLRISNEAYGKFKEMRTFAIKDYIDKGCKAFRRKDDQHIEETIFFYPLIGILNQLSNQLSENEE